MRENSSAMLSAGPKTDKEPRKVAAVHPVVKSLAGAQVVNQLLPATLAEQQSKALAQRLSSVASQSSSF